MTNENTLSGAQTWPEFGEDDVCAHNYAPLPVTLVRGDGVYVWDDQGRQYLDMMSAYSAVSHGHSHPRLVAALVAQAKRLAIVSRAFDTDRLLPFLKRACELTGMQMALPMNTGAEAVETAIKAARKWSYRVKGVHEDECEIIACEGNFHGRTLGAIALSTETQYRNGFGPFMPGVRIVPFGDADALERAITPNTAAFLVEPMQGEAGIRVPAAGYLARCAAICRRHRVLLLVDEVQTGLGRTGRMLACQHEAVEPDGLVLGKALGGGLLPISLFLARRDIMQVFAPGDHGSTFGGNPLAAAVGLEALQTLVDERLVERSAELGEHLLSALRRIRSPLIQDVRGKGLWCGVDFDPARIRARDIAERLLAKGILTKDTHDTVIRFAPPLIIERKQLDWALERFCEVVREAEELAQASKGTSRDVRGLTAGYSRIDFHEAETMKLTSASFLPDQPIPEQFAFGAPDKVLHIRLAANHNPHLKWSGAPGQTRSFALICVDPDAPSKPDDVNKEGRVVPVSLPRADFHHWAMVDIPSSVTEIAAGECSDGIVAGGKKEPTGPQGSRQGVNDYTSWFAEDADMSGTYRGYDGPCPPWNDQRRHRYHFTVYALSCERCPVDGNDFTAPQVLAAIKPHILAEARLTGTYAINPDAK